jgi:chromosome segregation ATPase
MIIPPFPIFIKQKAKLDGQLGYERGRNLAGQSDQRKKEVDRDRVRLTELQAQVAAEEGGLRKLEEAMAALQAKAQDLKTEVCSVADSLPPFLGSLLH